MNLSRAVLSSLIGLVITAPVAAWWLIGDLSSAEAIAGGIELDYAHRAVTFGAGADQAIGVLACIVVAGTVAVLLWAAVTRRLDPGWWLMVLPLVAAGCLASYLWRVSTAGVIGANIGAGLMTFLGGPVAVALLAFAAVMGRRQYRNDLRRSREVPVRTSFLDVP